MAHGLAAAGERGIVLVHDAARPFVPAGVVHAVAEAVEEAIVVDDEGRAFAALQ